MTKTAEEDDHAYASILDGNTTVVEVKQREDEDGNSGGEEATMGLVNKLDACHEDGGKCSQRSGVYNELFLGRSSMGVGAGDDSRDASSFTAVVTLIIVSE